MAHHLGRAALAASCAAAILSASAAFAQVPGIEAYRATPSPGGANVYSPDLPGPAGGPFQRYGSRNERAYALIATGNYREAQQLLARRLARTNDAEPRYLSAVAHAGLGETGDAYLLFADALARDEGHVGARVGLALTALQLGRQDEAATQLAILEELRADCGGVCRDAVALERGTRLVGHFLAARPTT